jgi:sacsin
LSWTNLDCCNKTIGLLDGINPVPEIDNIQFVSASLGSPSNKLFRNFALGECLDSKGLLQNVIVPAWENKKDRHWTSSCKEHLAEFVLGQFSLLSLDIQDRLRRIPLVPVSQLNGEETMRFSLAQELIDPTVPALKGLCFEDEEIVPKQSFLRKFNAALKGCGLKTAVDESFANHRIQCYASTKYPLQEVEKRAQQLLKAPCHWTTPLENQGDAKLSCLQWLPVNDHGGTLTLKASDECRGARDRLLVNSQLPILNTPISSEWERRLGWDKLLPRSILLSQLECGVVRKDREVVDAVLTYVSQRDLTKTLAGSLMGLCCVLVSSGLFVAPSNAFRPPTGTNVSCEGLQPYLANVENKFWQDHEEVLKQLKIGDQLQLSDLLKVQSILESKSVLGESDIDVAIQLAISAGKLRLPRASLAGLKVLSEDGRLYSIQDVNYDDLWPLTSKEKVTLTHPNIPKSTIDSLNVEGLRARLLKGMLDIEDVDDEDEFDQREKVTTRIADTLDRYPVETTFREYLANADDSEGASHISWLLDQRVHPTGTLMTPELEIFQGPALLVHNDGGKQN